VKVVDANVLLYAVNEDSPRHGVARRWLDRSLGGGESIGFAWVVLLAFVRLSTHPAVFAAPLDVQEALAVARGWLGAATSTVVQPTMRHIDIVAGLLEPLGTAANLVNDAHLAALAIEHGAEVATFDTDFGRFPGVRWASPE